MSTNSVFSVRPLLVALWLVLVGTACGTGELVGNQITGDPVREQLAEARDLWAQAGLDTYAISYDYRCFCDPINYEVEVVDGRIESAVRFVDGVRDLPDDGYTVELMFDEIEAALDAGAPYLEAEYDSETGRPLRFYIDEDDAVADDEYTVAVTEFSVGGETAAASTPLPDPTRLPDDFCEVFTFLDDKGSEEPETSAEAELMMAVFLDGTQKLAALAPPELADDAAALASLFVRADQVAAAQNYDPELFKGNALASALGEDFDEDEFVDFFSSAQEGCRS